MKETRNATPLKQWDDGTKLSAEKTVDRSRTVKLSATAKKLDFSAKQQLSMEHFAALTSI